MNQSVDDNRDFVRLFMALSGLLQVCVQSAVFFVLCCCAERLSMFALLADGFEIIL